MAKPVKFVPSGRVKVKLPLWGSEICLRQVKVSLRDD